MQRDGRTDPRTDLMGLTVTASFKTCLKALKCLEGKEIYEKRLRINLYFEPD